MQSLEQQFKQKQSKYLGNLQLINSRSQLVHSQYDCIRDIYEERRKRVKTICVSTIAPISFFVILSNTVTKQF